MKRLIYYSFLLIFYSSFAQIDYSGQLLDARTKEPLPYANIGIVGKGIGTVSNDEGFFIISLDTSMFENTDILQISSLGYETIEQTLGVLRDLPKDVPQILMQPSDIQLQEVVVSSDVLVPIDEFVGNRNFGEPVYGYWNDKVALGGELASKIIIKKGKRQLHSFEFEVIANPADSLLVRINFYEIGGLLRGPGANLNTSQQNILYTIPKGDNLHTVDLDPYSLVVQDDFFVSLELLKVYGDSDLDLVLAASNGTGYSFRRYASQGKWELIGEVPMAYYLKSSTYVSQKKARKYEAKVQKARSKKSMLSGFAIFRGKMIAGVTVQNERTKETVQTDENGRYVIEAKKKDVILFSKTGYKTMFLQVRNDQFANAILKLEGS